MMQKYPKHTRPNIRARAYVHNLMPTKGAHIRYPSYFKKFRPHRRCKWCNQPVQSEFGQWPNLCGRCGTVLGTWQNERVLWVTEELLDPHEWGD